MTPASAGPDTPLRRLVAAYKLRLLRAGERLGVQSETWGQGITISREAEENLLAGDDEYRLSPYPYPGLRSFDPEEGEIFFGRERNVREVQSRLAAQRIVVVLGGSGSGKSSLLRAGLLPYLNTTQRIPGRDGSWYKAEFRPRMDPLGELVEALVEQWLLPLVDLKVSTLTKAMGLPEGVAKEDAREQLRRELRARFFDGDKAKPREDVLNAFLDITSKDLDKYDHAASEGLRVPGPSMMILLDQLEEIFRPEISPDARASLLNLIVDLHNRVTERSDKGSVFLAITLRSEELHRCAEHRNLADVINNSLYLLELLDPGERADRSDLHRAIVQPARNVFDDWGLSYDRNCPDAPFAEGMPARLLAGSIRSSAEIEHRPDQLPLLQHALQATWHAAMRRWSTGNDDEKMPTIERSDLPGSEGATGEAPDLGACLRVRADKAAKRAANRFAEVGQTSPEVGEAALQAAFRALARRDDNGTWARRFAEPADINSFMAADPALARMPESLRRDALRGALDVFVLRGYLSGGHGRPYDISHEALIRNWPKFREWLREPEEVAYALGRILAEVDPKKFLSANDAAKMELIPADVAGKIALLGGEGRLPSNWAADQIAAALAKPGTRQRWGAAKKDALLKIVRLSALANDLRERAGLAKQEEKFKEQKRASELKQARILTRRTVYALVAVSILAAVALVQTWYANKQERFANEQAGIANDRLAVLQLRATFEVLNDTEQSLASARLDANSKLMRLFQNRRDAARARSNPNQPNQKTAATKEQKGSGLDQQIQDVEKERERSLENLKQYVTRRSQIVTQINAANAKHWSALGEAERKNRIDIVVRALQDSTLRPENRLRVALLATAAIPADYLSLSLNQALRNAIRGYWQFGFFHPPGASQVWGVAVDPKNAHRAAVGDDNGVVWLWDPLDPSKPPDAFSAADGVVNSVAFSADGRWLAATYRTNGAVLWDLETRKTICPLRHVGAGEGGAYGVALHGTTLAVAGGDGKVYLWDVSKHDQGCPDRQWSGRSERSGLIFGVAFSPDGSRLAAASEDGTVTVWRDKSPKKTNREFELDRQYEIPNTVMFAAGFSPDGQTLAATGADGIGRLWDLRNPEGGVSKETARIPSNKEGTSSSNVDTIGQVAFSLNEEWVVASAKAGGSAIGAGPRTGSELWSLDGGDQELFGIAFSPDSQYLLTGNVRGVVGASVILPGEVIKTNRDALLAAGFRALVNVNVLSADECNVVRNMRVPIFALAGIPKDNDSQGTGACRIPFLESVPQDALSTAFGNFGPTN